MLVQILEGACWLFGDTPCHSNRPLMDFEACGKRHFAACPWYSGLKARRRTHISSRIQGICSLWGRHLASGAAHLKGGCLWAHHVNIWGRASQPLTIGIGISVLPVTPPRLMSVSLSMLADRGFEPVKRPGRNCLLCCQPIQMSKCRRRDYGCAGFLVHPGSLERSLCLRSCQTRSCLNMLSLVMVALAIQASYRPQSWPD